MFAMNKCGLVALRFNLYFEKEIWPKHLFIICDKTCVEKVVREWIFEKLQNDWWTNLPVCWSIFTIKLWLCWIENLLFLIVHNMFTCILEFRVSTKTRRNDFKLNVSWILPIQFHCVFLFPTFNSSTGRDFAFPCIFFLQSSAPASFFEASLHYLFL